MSKPIRILVVGCGHMGMSHAKAYHSLPEFEIVGVVARGEKSRHDLLAAVGGDYPQFSDYAAALAATKPDAAPPLSERSPPPEAREARSP